MLPKGLSNADAIIEACKKMLQDLGEEAKPEWKEILNHTIATIEDMKGKFFIKTNFAIPVTNALLKDVIAAQAIAASGDLGRMPEATAKMKASLENLIQRGKMDGVSLT